MNAKEIVEKLQKSHAFASLADSDELADDMASVLKMVIRDVELLVPNYRPPQTNEDGKWCFLQMMHHLEPRLYEVALRPDGVWRYRNENNGCWYDIKGGVWPCERPEGGAT